VCQISTQTVKSGARDGRTVCRHWADSCFSTLLNALLWTYRAASASVDDEVTLDLSIRRDATVDALLSLQSEPIDFSKKTSRDAAGADDDAADAADAGCRR